jgi:hypothetical protein
MGHTIGGYCIGQGAGYMILLNDPVKRLRAVFACKHEIGHSELPKV